MGLLESSVRMCFMTVISQSLKKANTNFFLPPSVDDFGSAVKTCNKAKSQQFNLNIFLKFI